MDQHYGSKSMDQVMDELWTALELATTEELEQLADLLFRRQFNPIDYVTTPTTIEVKSQSRYDLMLSISERFRFLAADGVTVLLGQSRSLSYRQVLEKVCQHLQIQYAQTQDIADIESEVFLNLIQRSWQKLPAKEKSALNTSLQEALTEADLQKTLPLDIQRNPLSLVVKGGSALAITAVLRPMILNLLARQMAWHFATYQVGRELLQAGGTAIATRLHAYVTTYLAKRSMVAAATQYTAARTVFALLTPALWGLFFADLGWRTIATNYGRIIPAIFIIAQIRLLRGD
jgi:uncharacterized protein YaaW (UPF0174 family)